MIRAAVYARKSSDDSDRDAEAQSCQRQIDAAVKYAAEQGWTVDPRHVYRDDAVSGAEWKHRDGWNKLLAALEPAPAFSRLIVSELSRIGRDTVRTPAAILAVEEAGVEIFSYLSRQQITLSSEMGEMSTTLQSLLASFERRRASERTKDALRRRAEAGAATGGPPYGYGTMRNGDGYSRFVINPIEAGVVREIFQWFDEGAGVMRIPKRLNEGVAAPRGGRKGWAPVSVSQLLRRPIYAGVRVWNQRRNVMRGGTRGSQQARPAEEWITQGLPELALIDRETFDRVQGRLAERSALYLRTTTGQLIGRPRLTDGDPRYLLTGLLRCTCCNGALGPHTGGGRGRRSYYRCSAHHHRGLVGCRNGLRVLVDEVDRRVLDAVAKALAPETVKEAIQGAVALLTAQQAEAASRRGALTAELASVEARTRRLVDALAEGGVQAIRARLREETIKRDRLTAEIERLEQVPVPDVGKLLAAVEERARDLRGVLARHPQQARQVIRLLLGDERWDAEPFDGPEGSGYHFKATGDYRRLMSRELASITVGYFGSSKRCRMMRFLTRAVNGGHRCPDVVPVCRAILPISGARRMAEAPRCPPKHAPGKHSPERHGPCLDPGHE